jgi:hypothetical protein
MIDILFASVPGTITQRPILAPALLKACAKASGFDAQAIDLNIEVMNKIEQSPRREDLEKFLKEQEFSPGIEQEIGDLLDYCVDRITQVNPHVLGLSFLTQDTQYFGLWLCYHLSYTNPTLKIVIGGSGIKNFIADSSMSYAEMLKSHGYISDYINGDGEYSIIEYLKDNLNYIGINSAAWQPIRDLNQLPYPDFDDYNFDNYKEQGIPICDSRGCVRTCEFCDVIEHWKKYQYRTADNIIAEMVEQIKRYNIRKFFFYNSLTNGNMKEFRLLLDFICEYNDQHPDQQISWDGYFIVRNQQQHPEEFWKKLKKSNGFLQLGIESVIEKVRVALGKNFTNAAIDYHLAMAQKYSVPLLLLLIVGYPTETKEDFEFTKQWFKDRKQYARNTVSQVVFSLAAILPNTQLDKKQKEYGISVGSIPTIWITPTTCVTTQDRIKYAQELKDLLKDLNIPTTSGNNDTLGIAHKELSS